MNKRLLTLICITGFTSTIISCSKDTAAPPPPPPSDGKSFSLNGGTGGANAANSVYVDLSTEKQDSVKRTAWDLGFYCGSDFRVIINNTTAASAKAINKTDLAAVTTADTAGFADRQRFDAAKFPVAHMSKITLRGHGWAYYPQFTCQMFAGDR